jgi:hypothetical protein
LSVYVGEIEETTGKKIDLLNSDSQSDLATYLWKVDERWNKDDEISIRKDGQNEPGVITADGVVIDGNRRASILMKLYKKDGLDNKFRAAVLEHEFDSDRQRLELLETGIQIGTRKQKDYGAIEKYIKAKKMYDGGATIQLLATTWEKEEREILDYIEVCTLMNEYLNYIGIPGFYSRLENTEDMFLQLNKLLNSLEKNTGYNPNWEKTSVKVRRLKKMHFNLIRYTYNNTNSHRKLEPKKHGRVLMSTGRKTSLMQNLDLLEKYLSFLPEIEELSGQIRSIDDYKLNDNSKTLPEVASERDHDWSKKVSSVLYPNLERLVSEVELNSETKKPVLLLDEVKTKLSMLQELISKENFSESETYEEYLDVLISGIEDVSDILESIKIELNDPN